MYLMRTAFHSCMIFLLSLALSSSYARDIYVSPQGNDANQGGEQQPLRTIATAIQRAAAGDRIILAAGDYYGNVVVEKKGLTFIGLNRERAADIGKLGTPGFSVTSPPARIISRNGIPLTERADSIWQNVSFISLNTNFEVARFFNSTAQMNGCRFTISPTNSIDNLRMLVRIINSPVVFRQSVFLGEGLCGNGIRISAAAPTKVRFERCVFNELSRATILLSGARGEENASFEALNCLFVRVGIGFRRETGALGSAKAVNSIFHLTRGIAQTPEGTLPFEIENSLWSPGPVGLSYLISLADRQDRGMIYPLPIFADESHADFWERDIAKIPEIGRAHV